MFLAYLKLTYPNGPTTFSIKSILIDYLTGGASFHLWFFVLILQLYILYPLLAPFCHTIFTSKIKTALFLLILFLIPFLYQNEFFIFHNADTASEFYDVWNEALIFFRYLFYFVTGMYISLKFNDFKDFIRKINLKRFLIPLLFFNILGIIFYIKSGVPKINGNPALIDIGFQIFSFFEPIFYLLIFLMLFTFVLNMKKTELFSQYLKKIGNFSFGIYLIEVFFLTLLSMISGKINFTYDNYLYYPVVFSLTLLLSIMSIVLIRKLPFSQYIIGKIRD
jgi:surface polysaccharide O-acyltransferase-like enzyme